MQALEAKHTGNTLRLAKQLEQLTQLESRVTILGYVQRGGTPSAADRLLATRLGTACAELVDEGVFGVMVAARGRRRRAGAAGESGRQDKGRPPGPSLDRERAPCWDLPGRVTVALEQPNRRSLPSAAHHPFLDSPVALLIMQRSLQIRTCNYEHNPRHTGA